MEVLRRLWASLRKRYVVEDLEETLAWLSARVEAEKRLNMAFIEEVRRIVHETPHEVLEAHPFMVRLSFPTLKVAGDAEKALDAVGGVRGWVIRRDAVVVDVAEPF